MVCHRCPHVRLRHVQSSISTSRSMSVRHRWRTCPHAHSGHRSTKTTDPSGSAGILPGTSPARRTRAHRTSSVPCGTGARDWAPPRPQRAPARRPRPPGDRATGRRSGRPTDAPPRVPPECGSSLRAPPPGGTPSSRRPEGPIVESERVTRSRRPPGCPRRGARAHRGPAQRLDDPRAGDRPGAHRDPRRCGVGLVPGPGGCCPPTSSRSGSRRPPCSGDPGAHLPRRRRRAAGHRCRVRRTERCGARPVPRRARRGAGPARGPARRR